MFKESRMLIYGTGSYDHLSVSVQSCDGAEWMVHIYYLYLEVLVLAASLQSRDYDSGTWLAFMTVAVSDNHMIICSLLCQLLTSKISGKDTRENHKLLLPTFFPRF